MDNQDIHQLLAWLDAAQTRLDTAQGLGQDRDSDGNVAAARALIDELRAHPDAPEKVKKLLELLNSLGVMEVPPLANVRGLQAPARTGLGDADGVRGLSPIRGRCPKCGELREFCTCHNR